MIKMKTPENPYRSGVFLLVVSISIIGEPMNQHTNDGYSQTKKISVVFVHIKSNVQLDFGCLPIRPGL
jgi:hypothetical protein